MKENSGSKDLFVFEGIALFWENENFYGAENGVSGQNDFPEKEGIQVFDDSSFPQLCFVVAVEMLQQLWIFITVDKKRRKGQEN
jgi:hypothetical protein